MARIFTLADKVTDLFARSKHYVKPQAREDSARSVATQDESASVDTSFTYGIVDTADRRDAEIEVYIPQGRELVPIWFNPNTRDARPIPKK